MHPGGCDRPRSECARLHLPEPLGGGLQRVVPLRKAESDDRAWLLVLVEERRYRDGGDAMLAGQALRELHVRLVGNCGVIHELKKRAATGERTEPGVRNQ